MQLNKSLVLLDCKIKPFLLDYLILICYNYINFINQKRRLIWEGARVGENCVGVPKRHTTVKNPAWGNINPSQG